MFIYGFFISALLIGVSLGIVIKIKESDKYKERLSERREKQYRNK